MKKLLGILLAVLVITATAPTFAASADDGAYCYGGCEGGSCNWRR